MFKAAVCLLVALSVLSAAQDKPERIEPDVANRNLTKKVEPPVPPLAKAAGIGGTVIVDVVIGATGKVTTVTLISGHPMLAPAFIEAVRKWEYAPFVEDGRATSVITRVEWKVDSPNYSKAQEKALQDYYPAFRTCYDLVRKGNDLTGRAQVPTGAVAFGSTSRESSS